MDSAVSDQQCDSPRGDVVEIPVGEHVLSGTLWQPVATPKSCIVIYPATAVPQGLYRSFAAYLAEQGHAAVTFDWRGTGDSGHPRDHADVTMSTWINDDAPAVAAWARSRFPGLPHIAIGHSVGGHAVALGAGGDTLAGAVCIASHVGSTRTIPDPWYRARVYLIMNVVGPLLCRLCGYMPTKALGMGENIPAGAMLEWASWTRLPNYFFDDPAVKASDRAAAVVAPVLSVGLSDDPIATPAQVDAIASHFVSTSVDRRTYTPDQVGANSVGHMGFFRRGSRDVLWRDVLTWCEAQLAELPRR